MKFINLGEKAMLTTSMAVSRMINAFRNPASVSYRSILIIKDDEIGDMCYSTHVFGMLRRQYPAADITLLCKAYSKPLIESGSDINHIVTDWKELKSQYELIVELRTTWRSIGFSLRQWPKGRVDRGTVRFADAASGRYPHETETNFRVVEPLIELKNRDLKPKLYISEADRAKAEEYIQANALTSFALLHISARRILRRWPLINYCALAKNLNDRDLQVVFIGDSSEISEIEKARAALPFKTFSTAGVLSLAQLACLMQKAIIYIGNESGPLHMAAVQDVPSLGLFGPGPQEIFYPRGRRSAVIHHVLECNPCDQIHCVHPDNPCINRISVQEVMNEVNRLMNLQ